jgi:FkbM family methyltransferase
MRKQLKAAVKGALRSAALRLPLGARRTLLDTMVEDFGRAVVLRDLGRSFDVRSLSVAGEYGTIHGSVDDQIIFRRYLETKRWAPELVAMFRGFFDVHDGGTYLDIGANIGLTTVPVAQSADVTCYAFEPEPGNLYFLRRNVAENCHHGNVSVVPVALFDRKATLQFAISKENFGDHRIQTAGDGAFREGSWPTIDVQAERLDDVIDVKAVAQPLAVKIDTQGAEPAIFAGGRNVLAAAGLIALEFCPYMMKRQGGDIEAEIGFLDSNFSEGSIVQGDTGGAPVWWPMARVAGELQRLATEASLGTAYFDVVLRK